MIIQWEFFLMTGSVAEIQTEPIRISFHLTGELATTILLIAGETSAIKEKLFGKQILLIAFGMLLYTLIVSPGYFAQKDEWSFVLMFAVLMVFTIISILRLIHDPKSNSGKI